MKLLVIASIYGATRRRVGPEEVHYEASRIVWSVAD
jgi:hypothetical protein